MTLSIKKLRTINDIFNKGEINKRKAARYSDISRNTLKKYLAELTLFKVKFPENKNDLKLFLVFLKKTKINTSRYSCLFENFPAIYNSIMNFNSNQIIEWNNYNIKYQNGYRYTQFRIYFSKWLIENKLNIRSRDSKIYLIPENDLIILKKWRLSSDRRKWDRAVVILDSSIGKPISEIEKKIERSHNIINEWIELYKKNGLIGLEKKKHKTSKVIIQNIETKKANLITLIHETPKNFGINRTSWSLFSLSVAYKQKFGTTISRTMISEYIKSQGYAFRQAKKVLTSPDPNYREKLQNITNILSNLTEKQKFFSVDEFGPFAVKIQGGKSIVKKGEVKTYPQRQKSKGCLICTAALELSHNQITHFYSLKKDTIEMIKLLEILLEKYKNEEKIYFSWDAASWHASKKLNEKINELNNEEYRKINQTPIVELAPLPASAQFLNVIESVFSGLAKSIIHNSDYQSVDECKSAIDLYFRERNDFYLTHPKRAGKKIWGKERNAPIFDETKNFKDSRWR
jgi:transposase